MNFHLSTASFIKIVRTEALAKLGATQSYWIRVAQDKRSAQPLYAIAALRCEQRDEIHWLSAGTASPADAAKLMRTGFAPLTESDVAAGVVEALLKTGSAASVPSPTSLAA